MQIHKEGIKILLIQFTLFIIIWALLYRYENNIIIVSVKVITLLIFVITTWFFRVPKRHFERKENRIYAPCDGKVVVIEKTYEEEYYKQKRTQISIFMSPLNVHNNLYPVSGKITYTKYHKGKYLFAWNPKSSTDNERNTIVIENSKISVLCRQIAGALARRIVSYASINDKVISSDELGFIKFGSRVDIFLPIDVKPVIQLQDKVKAGKSVLATF